VAVTGAEKLLLSEAWQRVARVTGKKVRMVRAPICFITCWPGFCEWSMKVRCGAGPGGI